MLSILDRIVAYKVTEIAKAKEQLPSADLERSLTNLPPPRDFLAALTKPTGVQVIAEIKRASPSAGQLCTALDIATRAQEYASYGAARISVLTDEHFFHGSLQDLTRTREAVNIPLLRKDFVFDRYQLLEARAAGADAVLLIAELLDDAELLNLLQDTHQLGMSALVECYEPQNLARAISTGAPLIGINNRNLHTFNTSISHTLALASEVPADRCLVSESGIASRADVERLHATGVKAILVGETLMRATNLEATFAELCGVGQAK